MGELLRVQYARLWLRATCHGPAVPARQSMSEILSFLTSEQRSCRIRLRPAPRSGDRTQSPALVSQKREYSRHWPETLGKLASGSERSAVWRQPAELQMPANSGPFCQHQGQYPRRRDWVDEVGGIEPSPSAFRNMVLNGSRSLLRGKFQLPSKTAWQKRPRHSERSVPY